MVIMVKKLVNSSMFMTFIENHSYPKFMYIKHSEFHLTVKMYIFYFILQVGKAMSSNETAAYKIMRSLDVDYVLVIFGGVIGYSGDDINKFLWMVRIAEGEHPKDIRVRTTLDILNSSWDPSSSHICQFAFFLSFPHCVPLAGLKLGGPAFVF